MMRVIAGKYRSRILTAPRGQDTRPTSDRLRETLFNILGPRVEASRFVDLYAGSGAVGIEALSRGAAQVWFAESARAAVEAIRANLRSLGIAQKASIESAGTATLLKRLAGSPGAVDLVYVDPPYEAAGEYLRTLGDLGGGLGPLLAGGALVVAEHAKKRPLAESYGVLARTRVLHQGDAALSFFNVAPH